MDFTTLTLAFIVFGPVLFRTLGAAGGLRGLLHPRVREPMTTAIGASALYFFGAWLVQDHGPQSALDDWRGMGGVLIAFAIVIWFIATLRATSALAARKFDAARISNELDTLLDPTDRHFVVDDASAHRPLELLNELSQLIGPGDYAPGQPWATHEWIAERMPAARAVKPVEAVPRIDAPAS